MVFGITVAGRPADLPGVERMIGLFINTLPLRVRVRPSEALGDVLTRVQEEQAHLVGAHHVSLAALQQLAGAGAGALFDTLLVFENYPSDPDSITPPAELQLTGAHGRDAAHYPLAIIVRAGERLHVRMDYAAGHFDRDRIDTILDRLERMLEAIAFDTSRPVRDVELLNAAERRQVLEEWNTTAGPLGPSLVERFEGQAARTPAATAAVFEGARHVTYATLNAEANRLAHVLIARGIGPETVVGLALPRTPSMLVGVLGVLKAGATYLPIDPAYPPARLAWMFEDTAPACIVTTAAIAPRMPRDIDSLCLDAPSTRAALRASHTHNPSDADRTRPLHPEHPAYVTYTSGSTGRPKGIALSHLALANLVEWHHASGAALSLPAALRTLQFASLTFDGSIHEMFTAWAGGSALCVATDDMRHDVQAVAAWMAREQIEKAILPVVVAQELAFLGAADGDTATSLLELVTSGEHLALTPEMRRWFAPGRMLLSNHYGPSESHVATAYTFPRDPTEWPAAAPIGHSIPNTRVYVLDPRSRPCPSA